MTHQKVKHVKFVVKSCNSFSSFSLCNIYFFLSEGEIVERRGGGLRDEDLVILFYAHDGARRSSAPLRRNAHLKNPPGAPRDCAAARISLS